MSTAEYLPADTSNERPTQIQPTLASTMADVLAEQMRASIQARYFIAQKNPRDWDEVRAVLLRECKRPSFAAVAVKRKPGVPEPMFTIRFAEAAQRTMRNVEPTRIITFEDDKRRIVQIGFCDLESNINHSRQLIIEKTVERADPKGREVISQRMNSKGQITYLVAATEEEMFAKESAMGSKWERQLTLKILPGDIQDECFTQCLSTQRDQDAKDPEGEKKRLIDAYYAMGVRPDNLKEYLGLPNLDNLTPRDLEDLRQVYAAIRDADTNWNEVMDERRKARGEAGDKVEGKPQSRTQAVREAVKSNGHATPAAAPEQQQQAATQPPPQQQQKPAASKAGGLW